MKNVAQIVDQRNNEIQEYWYSTNVDETTYICNYGSKSNLLLPRFGMIKYPLFYLRSAQGSITLNNKIIEDYNWRYRFSYLNCNYFVKSCAYNNTTKVIIHKKGTWIKRMVRHYYRIHTLLFCQRGTIRLHWTNSKIDITECKTKFRRKNVHTHIHSHPFIVRRVMRGF